MDAKKMATRMEWSLILRGVLAIVFGIIALAYTGQTLLALVYVFGVFAMLSGLLEIVAAVGAGELQLRWGWLLFAGLISIAAGIVCFVWPNITALALVYIIGAWALVVGVAEIAFALTYPEFMEHPWLAGLSGVLTMIFGFLLVLWPRSGAVALTWLVGIYAILYGLTLFYRSYVLHTAGGADVRALFGKDNSPQPTS